jgi:hypothetical protein
VPQPVVFATRCLRKTAAAFWGQRQAVRLCACVKEMPWQRVRGPQPCSIHSQGDGARLADAGILLHAARQKTHLNLPHESLAAEGNALVQLLGSNRLPAVAGIRTNSAGN